MNQTLELLLGHRSDRSFTDEPLQDATLGAIVEAAWRAPTSTNAQHISLVVVRDADHRARIAEIAGGQPWIARAPVFIVVLLDFHKTRIGVEAAGAHQEVQQSVEALIAGSVDAGIALTSLMVAARSQGLGVVPIGGIRRDMSALVKLLKLPPLTLPVVGVAIGHIQHPAFQKPRLPLETFRHDEEYQATGLAAAIATYDETLSRYWREIGRADGLPWSQNTARIYQKVYSPDTKRAAAQQGFTAEN